MSESSVCAMNYFSEILFYFFHLVKFSNTAFKCQKPNFSKGPFFFLPPRGLFPTYLAQKKYVPWIILQESLKILQNDAFLWIP